MLTSKKAKMHRYTFNTVTDQLVKEPKADLLFGCEVGGHQEGFKHAKPSLQNQLEGYFNGESFSLVETDNYIALYGFNNTKRCRGASTVSASDDDFERKITFDVGKHKMNAVITTFDIKTEGKEGPTARAHVIVGNMHIVCGKRPPSIPTRQKIVRMLRDYLEGWVGEPNIPVVRIILGDNNLVSIDARDALRRGQPAHAARAARLR